jgi:cytochrome c oxidase subunit II
MSTMKLREYVLGLLCVLSGIPQAHADLPYNMPYGVTTNSQSIYNLHMLVFAVCCVIAAVVFGLIIYCLYHFRKSKGAVAAQFHENTKLEIIWTAIPFLILIGLAIPATNILGDIHDTSASAITIKVTGYQWKWKYEYLENNVKFFSFLATSLDQINGKAPKDKWFLLEVDNEVVVPVNTKVKLLVTSDDVIHSWWVPELGVKQDAVPGYINENWFYAKTPGKYRGQCGELCGVNHGFMPIVVSVVTQDEYNQWVKQKQQEMAAAAQHPQKAALTTHDIMTIGKREYERNCAMCHQQNGEGLAYTYPALKRSRVVTAPPEETILYVLRGVPNAAMQPFGQILNDYDLAAVISYIRMSWGNEEIISQENLKQAVTPAEVQHVRTTFNLH